MSALTERFDAIWARIAKAVAGSGRPIGAVRLVAVSKNHSAETVAELAAHWSGGSVRAGHCAGRPLFGESYMQEAREKMPAVRALLRCASVPDQNAPEWHFVGHVQSKKSRDIVGQFSLIHSVDSLKLAEALRKAWQSRVAAAPLGLDEAAPARQNILIQVNVGREEQKSGVLPEALEPLIEGVAAMPELKLQGLMCIPPLAEIGGASRPYFVLLRQLRDKMESACGLSLPELSMGMSDDFETAVEEGATLVRIGTDIFGSRAF